MTIFYTLGIVLGTMLRYLDLASEWFMDGYNAARYYSEPREVPERRTPVIDLAEMGRPEPELHGDDGNGVPGVPVPNR